MAYATPAQFEARFQETLDDAATAAVVDLLDDATAVIDDEIGMGPSGLESRTDTVTLDADGGRKLLLPRWPVTAVNSVVTVGADGVETALVEGTDWTWSAAGILTRVGGCWPCRDRSVLVEVTAGHSPVPAGVRRICLRLAGAGRRNPAGADSEDIGDTRVRWHTPGMELTTAEKTTLGRYGAR